MLTNKVIPGCDLPDGLMTPFSLGLLLGSPLACSAASVGSSRDALGSAPRRLADTAAFIDSVNAQYEDLHRAFEEQFWGTKVSAFLMRGHPIPSQPNPLHPTPPTRTPLRAAHAHPTPVGTHTSHKARLLHFCRMSPNES